MGPLVSSSTTSLIVEELSQDPDVPVSHFHNESVLALLLGQAFFPQDNVKVEKNQIFLYVLIVMGVCPICTFYKVESQYKKGVPTHGGDF